MTQLADTRDFVLLYVNGVRHVLRGQQVFKSLSDYLRHDLGLVGTKIVCAEGDCGACAVLVGRANQEQPDRLQYAAADSCILFLWQLDCRHVVTIEGLARDGQLSPVQQAMVDCHGSQCGFCTPGFVMQLTDLLDGRDRSATPDDVRLALSGSLCRCTGYEPILDAACSLAAGEVPDTNKVYSPASILADFAVHQPRPIDVAAPPVVPLEPGEPTPLRRFYAPTMLIEALRFKALNPTATVISGGTEIGVRINKHQADPVVVMTLTQLPEEHERVEISDGQMNIGGRATWTAIERACETHLPEFTKIIRLFGGPAIRNVATLAGNIANGSPIADGLPVLMVMGATLQLTSETGTRRVPINSFYKGYKQTELRRDELITQIYLPLPGPGDLLKLYKVSKRRDLDISTFTAGIWMQCDGERIAAARIAFGGVAPVVLRMQKTEQFLVGQPFVEATFRTAGKIARSEIAPIADVRGSQDYRWQLGENILLKFFHECEAIRTTVGV